MGYQILGKEAGNIGYGMMGLNRPRAADKSDDEKVEVMKAALEAGATSFNGGLFYGTPDDNSLTLLRKYFEKYPEDVKRMSLNIKGGFNFPWSADSVVDDPEGIRKSVQTCLDLLGDKGHIDMWEMCRRVSQADYLDSLRMLDGFVKEGKIGGIAMSEVNANSIRQAVKIVKVEAVEVEISLFQTDPLTDGICEACAELNIPIFAYSPLGRGFLTGQIKDRADLEKVEPVLKMMPRFSEENFHSNLKLVEQVEKWAAKKNCTMAQFAINWVASLSKRPGMPRIIPIPSGGSLARVQENLRDVELTDADMDEVDAWLKEFIPTGARQPEMFNHWLDKTTTADI